MVSTGSAIIVVFLILSWAYFHRQLFQVNRWYKRSFGIMSPVEIDGSILEGGGQILRIAASLSVLMGRPIHITNIRAGRSKPGLRPQHLKGLEVLQKLCRGNLENSFPNSVEVRLFPRTIEGGEYEADTGTAGSITLLLQISLPCLLFANCPTYLKFRGGTNTDMAPQLDYMTEVFLPALQRFGASFDYKFVRRGFYPQGGGEAHFQVFPIKHLEPIVKLDPGQLVKIWGWAFVAGTLPIKMAQAAADAAINVLRRNIDIRIIDIQAYKESRADAFGNGFGIYIVAQTSTGVLLGGTALQKRGKTPEDTGKEAAIELEEAILSGTCVDKYTQDQIIIFMALAKGDSQVLVGDITEHTRTAIHICEIMTQAKFRIEKTDKGANILHCTGIGLENNRIP